MPLGFSALQKEYGPIAKPGVPGPQPYLGTEKSFALQEKVLLESPLNKRLRLGRISLV